MTGENFLRINKHDEHLQDMLNGLAKLREDWYIAYHDTDNEKYFNIVYDIENKLKKLKHCIYIYVYNKNSKNYDYIKDFEKRYLW